MSISDPDMERVEVLGARCEVANLFCSGASLLLFITRRRRIVREDCVLLCCVYAARTKVRTQDDGEGARECKRTSELLVRAPLREWTLAELPIAQG
jgi:hypothetical protein